MFVRGWKLALVFVLGMTVGGLLMSNLAAPAPAASAALAGHPHLHTALDELRAARDELKAAESKFGGHKEEAVDAIDKAIRQIKICIDNE